MKYAVDALKNIPIEEVLEEIGAIPKNRKQFHCPNGIGHNSGVDKNASLSIDTSKNTCKCWGCGEVYGDTINVAIWHMGDFKSACEWLHQKWNIPYLDNTHTVHKKFIPVKKEQKIEYLKFDTQKEYALIHLKEWIHKYSSLKKPQRLKMVYSFIYRFSLQTEQFVKNQYYKRRCITHQKVKSIGYLSNDDIQRLSEKLVEYFSIEDLVEFKVFNDSKAKHPLQWKYYNPEGFAVVPSFDLYSNMNTGLMLRGIAKANLKEFQLSCPNIVLPLPFALDRESFSSSNETFIITEGHTDALSLDEKKKFIAIPGVHNFKQEFLGLLKGHKLIIAYDQDTPGQNAAYKTLEMCFNAGVVAMIAKWDKELGKDINELLVNNNLRLVKELR